jgi:hypothetical protein
MDSTYRLPRIDLIEFCKSYNINFKEHFALEFDKVSFTSGNISFFEMVALATLIVQLNPNMVMEFGTFNGRTTLNMALNMLGGNILTVDLPKDVPTKLPLADGKHEPDDELGFIGLTDKMFTNYPKRPAGYIQIASIQQIWSDTAIIDQGVYRDHFDFMFVDASHSYENCLNDTATAFELVKQGGIITWHDYNGWPGVTKALNQAKDTYPTTRFFWIHDTSIVVAMNNKRGQ